MKKLIIPLLLLSIVFAGCTIKQNISTQACTEEAKVCSDGSTVARTLPNCEFAECPLVESPTVITTGTSDIPQACTMEAKLCPD
jgi:hypothetical protein